MTRWQFSLRALLILTTLLAAVVAFAANYPLIAMLLAAGTAWLLFESGAIVDIIAALSKPAWYARHPFLTSLSGLLAGISSFAVAGFGWWQFRNDRGFPGWLALLFSMCFAALGVFSFRLIWLAIKGPDETEGTQSTDER